VVAKPTEMQLYSETGFAEVALKRAAGNMASIVGSGGALVALFAAASAPQNVVALGIGSLDHCRRVSKSSS
jgi:hypothetical protein